MRSVELVFDEESDAGGRRAWDALIERGLPSAGRHAGATNAPHVTLAVLDGTDRAGAEDARLLSGLAGRLPLELALSGIILFGDGPRRVLACPVIVAADLLALQREVAARLGGAERVIPHAVPDAWTPHVTLARRMPVDRLAEALDLVGDAPSRVRAVRMRVWDAEAKRVFAVGEGQSASASAR